MARYRVTFRSPETGDVTSLKCSEVGDSPLGLGFVCVAGLDFGTRGPIVNPEQDRLARRFEDTRRLHLHIHAVLAIEELTADPLALDGDRSKLIVLERPEG
jgi:hypothetical protein